MFCTSCGAELTPGGKFCTNCGTRVAVPEEPVVEAPAESVVEAPAEPVVEAPAEPVVETLAEPVVETPAEPAPVFENTDEPAIPEPAFEAPEEPAIPEPAVEAPDEAAPAFDAPVEPAPTQYGQSPSQAPARTKASVSAWSIFQILLLIGTLAAAALLFVGTFGYEVEPDYNNRFSAFALCAPFINGEVNLTGIWNTLIFVAVGIALVSVVCALLALLLRKPALNILPVVCSIGIAVFTVFCFYAFGDALEAFLTDYVTSYHLTNLTGYALLTECGIILIAVCALNVILGIVGLALGKKAEKTPALA